MWRIEVCGSGNWTVYTSGFASKEVAVTFAHEHLPSSTLWRVVYDR
jgi:hypothetical protein